jgi:ribose phosphate pyrophosphokinase-like protein
MILFTFFNYKGIGQELETIASLRSGQSDRPIQQRGIIHGQVQGPISSEHRMILGSIAPPDDQLFSLSLLAHTLRKEKAEKITAILPYLAYCRED